MDKGLEVTIVGGGMITADLILPAVYHLEREGIVGEINICGLNSAPLRELKNNRAFKQAFPGQGFTAYPKTSESPKRNFPGLYRQVVAGMPPRQAVIVAVPDPMHYEVVTEVLGMNQHVLCVKPLALKYEHSRKIEKLAYEKGLFVGVEYHKRFDRRSLIARTEYRQGNFGEFILGEAKLIEPYFYRRSNFQNWFTYDATDPFVYVGCHYVDLVYFITGLKPVAVSVEGVKGKFPNGKTGFLWSAARVRYENGAILSITNGLGYPDDAAGANDQGLVMYCEGRGRTGMLRHDDQNRGVEYSYLGGLGLGGSRFNFINPDFFKLVPWEGKGYKPAGYGFDSVAATLTAIHRLESEVISLANKPSLLRRRQIIQEIDRKGIIATPANSYINELVTEAGRLSILKRGKSVKITYGRHPGVRRTG